MSSSPPVLVGFYTRTITRDRDQDPKLVLDHRPGARIVLDHPGGAR